MQKLSEKVLKSMRGAILGAMVVLLVLTFGVTALVLRPKIDTLLETVARTKAGEIDYFLGRRLNEMTLLRKAYRPDATGKKIWPRSRPTARCWASMPRWGWWMKPEWCIPRRATTFPSGSVPITGKPARAGSPTCCPRASFPGKTTSRW